jgi:DNA phosphorothioation-dependent restriction protein DptG
MFSLRLNLRPKKELSIGYVLCEARLNFSIEHIRSYTDCSNPREEIRNWFALSKEHFDKRGSGVLREYCNAGTTIL